MAASKFEMARATGSHLIGSRYCYSHIQRLFEAQAFPHDITMLFSPSITNVVIQIMRGAVLLNGRTFNSGPGGAVPGEQA